MAKIDTFDTILVNSKSYECSITTDITVFGYIDGVLNILLLNRTVGKFENHWMLPGGAMVEHENLEDCAKKVLNILTGFKNVHFEQVRAYGAIDRHPLKRVITVSFYALVKPENHPVILSKNVSDIKWFQLNELPNQIAFDHKKIITDAHTYLKLNLKDKLIVGELLPKEFTLNELQVLYESILQIKLDKRNFRKKIFQMNILKSTGKIKKGVKGGPVLYKYHHST